MEGHDALARVRVGGGQQPPGGMYGKEREEYLTCRIVSNNEKIDNFLGRNRLLDK
jgi:hypothetical protein